MADLGLALIFARRAELVDMMCDRPEALGAGDLAVLETRSENHACVGNGLLALWKIPTMLASAAAGSSLDQATTLDAPAAVTLAMRLEREGRSPHDAARTQSDTDAHARRLGIDALVTQLRSWAADAYRSAVPQIIETRGAA